MEKGEIRYAYVYASADERVAHIRLIGWYRTLCGRYHYGPARPDAPVCKVCEKALQKLEQQ